MTPAEKIIRKFGGAYRLSEALAALGPECYRRPSTIYRWTYPKEKRGTDGRIPTRDVDLIKAAARGVGVYLTTEDFV